jgi:outer membrane protein OmpA-like peptidoglycan-associated protein
MNATQSPTFPLIAAAVAAALLAGCATVSTQPAGSAALRTRLTTLQADPQLAGRAPLAIEQANTAVTAAEKPQADPAINAHLQFMADREISIATAQAQSQLAVDQRKDITEQRAAMQLKARTQETDVANQKTAMAVADGQHNTDVANQKTAMAVADGQRNAADLQQQIDDLQAKVTDRGLVLTLGDVLFTTGTATLNMGAGTQLSKLAGFLNNHADRTAQIDGYTDSVGSDEYNQGLSQRRADSVKSYLVNQGIAAGRLVATGKGESSPVGDNASETGRQQNRRVEVIIANSAVAAR